MNLVGLAFFYFYEVAVFLRGTVTERTERRAGDNSPERVRALARQALREQKADEAFALWLREQRDRAYVEYRLDQG